MSEKPIAQEGSALPRAEGFPIADAARSRTGDIVLIS